jgi:hypothetical protein
MKNLEIKELLDSGDQKFISRSTGYSPETVRKVLGGQRNNDKILKAAQILVEGKKSLAEQIEIMVQN